MRLIRRSFYECLGMRNSGMEWASELLIRTSLLKGKYEEVVIDFHKDARERPPHLARWVDGWRHLKAIILLKPKVLLVFALLSFILSFITWNKSIAFSYFFSLAGLGIVLMTLAALLLLHSLTKESDAISEFLLKINLPAWVLGSSLIIFLILLLPSASILKYYLSSLIVLLVLWLFFVETIKTHLINNLEHYDAK